MDYRRYAPAPELNRFVEHYWSIVSPAPPAPLRAVLVPNGRATLQFCLGAPGRRFARGVPARENADVYLPVSTAPFVIEQEGASHYVGVQFTPWGGQALFPAAPETPGQVEALFGPLPDKTALAVEPSDELDRWLGRFLPARRPASEMLARAIERVDADPTATEVGDLAVAVGVSASTLYRAFRHGVGVSPKQYVQVMRYRAFTDELLSASGGAPTALLAALAGYADQSHASRDFTRFTGMTSTVFRETYDGIARLMARM